MTPYDFRANPKCPFGDLKWNQYFWEYPRNVPAYEEDYWGEVRDPDGKPRDMLSDEERKKQIENLTYIVDRIHGLGPGRLLDVGCGAGFLLSAISTDWDKHGVDLSSSALEHARKYATVKKGELPESGYADNSFDAVIMHHVIEHLPDPIEYVECCHRILKPEGLLIVGTPDFDSGCARHFRKNFRMLHSEGHISLFTSFSLVKLLEDYSFRILEVEFPFFETTWFTEDSLLRMLDPSKVSPPFYGSHVTVFAQKVVGAMQNRGESRHHHNTEG